MRVCVALRALTALLTVHEYSPASPRRPGSMTSDPPEMVIRGPVVRAAPWNPQSTATSVPVANEQVREMLLPSTATGGTARLTPDTATERRQDVVVLY